MTRGERSASGRGGGLGLGLILVMLSGCAEGDRVAVHPVKGQVKVKGEPAVGALVVFHPKGGEAPKAGPAGEPVLPSATVGPDGAFALTTYDEGDGAPSGEYAVTVEWNKLVTSGGESKAGPNVVPKPYGKPDSTPLHVSVKSGPNDLAPFEIEK